jgi:hypothetical protein
MRINLHVPDLRPIRFLLEQLVERVGTLATQEQVDQIAAQLDTSTAALSAGVQGLRSDIDALRQQVGDQVDLTPLQTRADALAAAVQTLSDLDAENPPPTPVEPPPVG